MPPCSLRTKRRPVMRVTLKRKTGTHCGTLRKLQRPSASFLGTSIFGRTAPNSPCWHRPSFKGSSHVLVLRKLSLVHWVYPRSIKHGGDTGLSDIALMKELISLIPLGGKEVLFQVGLGNAKRPRNK